MNYNNKRIAGLLFFVGAVVYIFGIIISEAVYAGYSVGQQYVSELGDWSKAGNSAPIFNVSATLSGLFVIAGAYFIQRVFKNRLFTSLLAMTGIGSVGIGVFALDVSWQMHSIFAVVTFVSATASVIMSYKFEKSPLSYISVILGAVMLVAGVLGESFSFYLGLGLGGMQRFFVYPIFLWMLGFGGYLIGEASNSNSEVRK